MKTLIVYSSRTGNTRMIAEAVHSVAPADAELFVVADAPDPADYDLLALGFWVDKGEPDRAMTDYMGRVQGKSVALFGTLGAWPDSDHARESMQKAVDRVPGSKVLGTFICQGKIDPKVLAAMAKMPEAAKHHAMTAERKARIAEAAKHPDENDCAAARKFFTEVLQQVGMK
ncbi:MAG: flavodoxin family protein [Desulfobulbus oligotrophicus]|jgi:flavodoxin|nr:flavodoxin family protein [Desulfobulbus oligotrophicus]